MSASRWTSSAASAAADAAIERVLRTQWQGERAVRLDSPPGAGKTGVVERLAVQASAVLGERCMLVTQTNEQAFDLARRLARGFTRLPFTLLVKKDLAIPEDLQRVSNLQLIRSADHLPAGSCVVIANAAKWSWVQGGIPPFDSQIVDEAFQLPDYRFQQIAGLAHRLVLVGDPGQIAPVISCETERWKSDPAGPQVASPRALTARHPGITQLSLPVSRRLVPDTVSVIQPAFYPDLPFTALSQPGERGLATAIGGITPLDRPIDLVSHGASLVQIELPQMITGEVDASIADTIVALIDRLVERGTQIWDGDRTQALSAAMIGVVCAHVSQVSAVRERLPRHLTEVFVETSDRFQGLERPVMVVHHPLSGRADASQFHLDAGRLCVMLSRHRVACFIVSRAGTQDLLLRYAPSGDRVLGETEDAEFAGWRAHLAVLQELRQQGRVVSYDVRT